MKVWGMVAAVWLAALVCCATEGQAQEALGWPDLRSPVPSERIGGGDAAVLVGIDDYVFVPDIPGARENVMDWAFYLNRVRGVPLGKIKRLVNNDGTREKIQRALQDAAAQVGPGGTLWFVFVGHGAPSWDGSDGVLVGADAQQDPESIQARSVARSEVLGWIGQGRQTHAVVVLDACFSGRTAQGAPLAKGLQPMLPVRHEGDKPGVTLLTAGTGSQFAGALPGAARPAFSYLLLGALRGWADGDLDGTVTAQEARDYADETLGFVLTGRRTQTPQLFTSRPGLVLSRGKGLEAGPDVLALSARGPDAVVVGSGGAIRAPARDKPSWDLDEGQEEVVVTFRSEPVGAAVMVDGRLVCQATPCSRSVGVGRHRIEMGGDCVESDAEAFEARRGQPNVVSLALRPRPAGVDIKAQDAEGNDLEAEVFVDGIRLGVTPGRFKVGVCARRLEVRKDGYGNHQAGLSLMERQVAAFAVRLDGALEPGKAAPPVAGMVQVPGGAFVRGSDQKRDEQPQQSVVLEAFWIDIYEVTVSQYAQCVSERQCTAPATGRYFNWGVEGRQEHPINGVDWFQAAQYCAWANKRLPTEAEWEKAARGTDGRLYPWGNAPASCEYAVMEDGGDGCGLDGTWPVGSKPKGVSPYGVHDMAGNVYEWTADWYGSGHYTQAQAHNPQGPAYGTERAVRGGSWSWSVMSSVRAADRHFEVPTDADYHRGFRCAR